MDIMMDLWIDNAQRPDSGGAHTAVTHRLTSIYYPKYYIDEALRLSLGSYTLIPRLNINDRF